jgi:hypothetical protein
VVCGDEEPTQIVLHFWKSSTAALLGALASLRAGGNEQ